MNRARIVLALVLAAFIAAPLAALMRPHAHAVHAIVAQDQDGVVDPVDVSVDPTTTLAPETTTSVQDSVPTPTTAVATTVPGPVPTTTAPVDPVPTTIAVTPTTVVVDTTTSVPETTTTTQPPLSNSFIACYPDNMPPPQVQMPGMDNPGMGPCHIVGTLPDGSTVVYPAPVK